MEKLGFYSSALCICFRGHSNCILKAKKQKREIKNEVIYIEHNFYFVLRFDFSCAFHLVTYALRLCVFECIFILFKLAREDFL